jgi:hypothetical protein
MISAPDPSCHKRARREEIGSDLGRAEEDRHSRWLEPTASEAGAEEPAHPEAPADAVSSPVLQLRTTPCQPG